MTSHPASSLRRSHPELPELAGGLQLSAERLRRRPDASKMEAFVQMLENAEYWLSFDLHAFEPVLTTAPSPLRELGVGVALKFSDRIDGQLDRSDVAFAEKFLIRRIAPDLRPGVTEALDLLGRTVQTRDRQESLCAEGFAIYAPEAALSVHALRARGRATIIVDGEVELPKLVEVTIGRPTRLSSVDDKGRVLDPPEVETDTGAPVLVRPQNGARDVIFMVPGNYRLRVPSRASGDLRVLVR